MSIKQKSILVILTVLVLGALIITSCTGGIARGWAGGVVSDGTLFVASMRGKLVAIDATGDQLKSIGTSVQLLVTTSGGLSCIPSCGTQSAPVVIYASPVVSGTTVSTSTTSETKVICVGGTDNKLYAYTFTNNVWSKDPEWIYPRQGTMSGAIIGGIIVDNNTIYFATSDGTVYALNASDLSFKWSQKIDSKIWSAPTVDGTALYVGCFDKAIYALNSADGSVKWKTKTEGAINSTPVVYNNMVYIGDYSRHFYALDTATGNVIWTFPSSDMGTGNPQNFFWAKPVVLNGIIYAANLDGNVYALDLATGKLLKTYTLSYSIASSPVVVGNYLVVATSVSSYAPTKQKVNIYIIDTTDGSKKEVIIPDNNYFKNAAINAPLFAYGNTVYIHTTKDNLWEIDTLTKTIKLPSIQSPPFSLVTETYSAK